MQFNVQDMTCGHCVAAITQAVESAFPQAKVSINLEQHRVVVDNVDDIAAVQKIIEEEGYTPIPAEQLKREI
ncbi:heavy-metal-associated domain-containing protein [Neopusillimonas maritima]|nr:heavy-metal-associated domain-containing protein [Neopusillimonas maritima]